MLKHKARQANRAIASTAAGLQDIIDGAEDLLESLQDQSGDAVDKLRYKVSNTLERARARLEYLDVPELTADAVDSTVGFIRRDPWRTVAIGALALLAISTLVNRGWR
jgi:ElaB/YqjD/DUF883 family membrane-anchored ribosome-binding protein